MESHFRSIVKAVTWRIGGTILTVLIALIITKKLELSLQIGLLDTIFKVSAFYVHERMWSKINFGRKKKPEYEI